MALSKKIQEALNNQLNFELHSAYLYLAMAAYLDDLGVTGSANWMRVQAQEELLHAMKVHDYLLSRNGRVLLTAVEAPPVEWPSQIAAFEAALAHEEVMTGRLNTLTDLAHEERDHATQSMLRWFIDEQVEEEATLVDIVNKFKMIGKDGSGLYLLEQELGARPAMSAADTP